MSYARELLDLHEGFGDQAKAVLDKLKGVLQPKPFNLGASIDFNQKGSDNIWIYDAKFEAGGYVIRATMVNHKDPKVTRFFFDTDLSKADALKLLGITSH